MSRIERSDPERRDTPAVIMKEKTTFREGDSAESNEAVDSVVEGQGSALRAITPEAKESPLTPEQIEEALNILKTRSRAKENRHLAPTLNWKKAEESLREQPKALRTVLVAEDAGHMPAIYMADEKGFHIGTLTKETPNSSRDCVYDIEAEKEAKTREPLVKFNGNAVDQATSMGWSLMCESQAEHIARHTTTYNEKGSSWYYTDYMTRNFGKAFSGKRVIFLMSLYPYSALNHSQGKGWRGSLNVLYKEA